MADKIYYTIPADVRYHRELTAGAKLLYGEIAFLCKVNGYCLMENSHFAELFGIHAITVSRWVQSLKKHKLIQYRIKHKFVRFIFLHDVDETHIKRIMKMFKGAKQKCLDNTTYYKQEQLSSAALADKDDFDIEEREWTDKHGKKHSRTSIDYGYGVNSQ